MNTAAWLVDIGYVVKTGAKGLFKIDYLKAEAVLARRFGSVRTFLFNGYASDIPIPDGLHKFYAAMRHHGMTVCLHQMREHTQRRVDVDLAAHMIWQASTPGVEVIVLTTGDQDFIPAVKMAQETFKKQIALFTYKLDVSMELQKQADLHLRFEDVERDVSR